MAYSGLNEFVAALGEIGEIHIVKTFVNPVLEITEIADRVINAGGKALLFENTGTGFPLLINAFGSDRRMALAIGRKNLDEAGEDIKETFDKISRPPGNTLKMIFGLPGLIKLAGILPVRLKIKGKCQKIVHKTPDLEILPVMKCWPHDGGRFITLPMVHTIHPESGKTNVGMYRMQVFDKNTTGMHWQRHKTGANHFEAWKKVNKIMPVSVALGGDPVYTYTATAPLPENTDEYILAGFLRKKRVRLVKCITNDLYVPEDSDIIIEGYVDPAEPLVWEGPFGDHTGFYSLADWYPKFHITCITHSEDAIYPATIVGIPPKEDAYLAKATERIFLSPIKLTLQPEIEDIHMPDPGVAHNLVIVRLKKEYPGQGMKVISALFGAGQMMFTKYLVVVSGPVDIRDYNDVLKSVFANTDFDRDLIFTRGPLDVLDHSSDTFSYGGKLGIDATVKSPEELTGRSGSKRIGKSGLINSLNNQVAEKQIAGFNISLSDDSFPVLILSVDRSADSEAVGKVINRLSLEDFGSFFNLILVMDHTVNLNDYFMVAWQLLGNSDPVRDHKYISESSIIIDGTIKVFRPGGFPRRWPDVVSSDSETINLINRKWELLDIGELIPSPSLKISGLVRSSNEEVNVK
jgi:4-hydroxy-3-polyprenylbenzoate decarboxylase